MTTEDNRLQGDSQNSFQVNERLIEIETKLAYQEDLLQSLNDIIIQQQNLIDLLQLRIEKLSERISSGNGGESFSDNAEDDLPPHY